MGDTKLDFIYIGAPRVASTWLAQCLSEHPQLCVSLKPEVAPFKAGGEVDQEALGRNLNYCLEGSLRGVAPTDFMRHPENFDYLRKSWPEIKVIAALREPVERAYSHFWHDKTRGEIDERMSFLEAIKKRPVILESGFYHKMLKPYWDNWPKENLIILWYEDIKILPAETIRAVYKFLGVRENFKPPSLNKTFNPTPERRLWSLRIKKWTDAILSLVKLIKRNILGRILVIFSKGLGADRVLFWVKRNNLIDSAGTTLKRREYEIPEEDGKFLKDVYREDTEKLAEMTGRDLGAWFR